ncbi:hypothetical protein AAZX31_07G061500 [Glycine max]
MQLGKGREIITASLISRIQLYNHSTQLIRGGGVEDRNYYTEKGHTEEVYFQYQNVRFMWLICFFQSSGDLTLNVYEEDCEFADPAGSFKGLQQLKRN